MAIMNDPYDPDEIRRRQLLAASMDSPPPTATGEAPDITAQVMGDDEGDAETLASGAYAGAGAGMKPGQLSPAQQKYRQTVESMPLQENYAPSKWRRFGAAVAGGLAGMKDAGQGIKTAQGILEAPHQEAQQDWASRVNREALSMGLDEKVAKQDMDRMRAAAAQQNANARSSVAARQVKHLDWQEAQTPEYKPKTREEYEGQLHIMHPGRAPTTFEQYSKDPNGYRNYLRDLQTGKVQPLTFEQRLALQRDSEAARLKLHTTPGAAPFEKPPFLNAEEQSKTEELAARQVSRLNPGYNNFIDWGEPGVKGGAPFRIKPLSEITDPKEKLLYNNFLTDIRAAKQRSLGVRRIVAGSSPWVDLEEE